MKARSCRYDELQAGDTATVEKRISKSDVEMFSELSGDLNPLHVDEVYAKTTQFKKVVVHGMYIASLVSQLVGMKLPGAYSLLVKESLEFKKPVFIGDTVIVKGTIVHKSDAARLVEIAVEVGRGSEVVAGGTVHVRLLQ